jgi:hypothetical protein
MALGKIEEGTDLLSGPIDQETVTARLRTHFSELLKPYNVRLTKEDIEEYRVLILKHKKYLAYR